MASTLDFSQIQVGIDALSEGFVYFDSDDNLVSCNAAFRRLFPDVAGYLRPGTSWSVFLHEALQQPGNAVLNELDAHLNSQLNSPFDSPPTRQGNRWLQLSLHPRDDGSFVVTSKDVAEQRKAVDIIEQADDLLRDVLDACASRISVSSVSDGKMLYTTPAWRNTFGEIEHIQHAFKEPLDYTDVMTELLASSNADDLEFNMRRDCGDFFPARMSARLVNYQSEPSVVISTEDMSQLYQQRDEIVRTNQRVLDAIEALDQGFALFDHNHCLLQSNQLYLDLNQPIADVVRPGVTNAMIVQRAVDCAHEPMAAGWHADALRENDVAEFVLPDKREFSVTHRTTSDGGFVLAWSDITEKRRTERELKMQREAAFQSEKLNALGQLLAGVAHELNNPLSVVVGHALMLKDEIDNDEALDGVERISNAAERCSKIVKTFLAMARQKPVSVSETSINDIVGNAMEIVAYGLRQHNVEIELDLTDTSPEVAVDEDQITQVLINLLLNAEQAMSSIQDTPKIRISTLVSDDKTSIDLRVSDNGPGIPEALQVRIFEPFFTTKPVNEGTGVGLALSHQIAASHGGSLKLGDSELGGASFVLTLPIASFPVATKPQNTDVQSHRLKRALLVEDEADVAYVLNRLLNRLDIDCLMVESAESAIKQLEQDTAFDLLVCDLRMPGLGGYGLSLRIKEQWPALASRLMFVTGDAISTEADKVRSAGEFPILEKPVSPSELREAVQAIAAKTEQLESEKVLG